MSFFISCILILSLTLKSTHTAKPTTECEPKKLSIVFKTCNRNETLQYWKERDKVGDEGTNLVAARCRYDKGVVECGHLLARTTRGCFEIADELYNSFYKPFEAKYNFLCQNDMEIMTELYNNKSKKDCLFTLEKCDDYSAKPTEERTLRDMDAISLFIESTVCDDAGSRLRCRLNELINSESCFDLRTLYIFEELRIAIVNSTPQCTTFYKDKYVLGPNRADSLFQIILNKNTISPGKPKTEDDTEADKAPGTQLNIFTLILILLSRLIVNQLV